MFVVLASVVICVGHALSDGSASCIKDGTCSATGSETNSLSMIHIHSSIAKSMTEVDPSRPAVAGVIAVHPPKFRFLHKFLERWSRCSEGQAALTVMPVFSTSQDQASFDQLAEGAGLRSLYTPLIAQPTPSGVKPQAWKKLDGLANVLENFPEDQFEFVLLLDSEIAAARCEGFSGLRDSLRRKHESKTWFAAKTWGNHETNTSTSWTKYPYTVERVNAFAAKSIARDRTEAMLLRTLTSNFSYNMWWADLPYVHLKTARRMFNAWGKMLQASHGVTTGLPSALQVSVNMSSSSNVPQLRNAAVAFEHLIYQYYCVLHEGFSIVGVWDAVQNFTGEKFWYASETWRNNYLSIVKPSWLPAPLGCSDLATTNHSTSDILLIYHLDRCSVGKKVHWQDWKYDNEPAEIQVVTNIGSGELEQLDRTIQQSWCAQPREEQTQYSTVWHDVLPHVTSSLKTLQLVNSTHSAAYMFGVAQGDGLPLMRKLFPEAFLYGFDSFAGLPEETHKKSQIAGWRAGFFKPLFSEDEALQRAGGASLAKIVRGFYNESLTRRLVIDSEMPPAFYVDIDCDLKVSTHDALDWVFANRVARVGTLIGYDDWWTIPCFNFHHNANSSVKTRLSTVGTQQVVSPLSVGEGLAHSEIAQKYGVHFKCVAGPCKMTPRSFSECHINNNWGPVFLVTAIGEDQGQDGFEFTHTAQREWMKNMKVCRTVG